MASIFDKYQPVTSASPQSGSVFNKYKSSFDQGLEKMASKRGRVRTLEERLPQAQFSQTLTGRVAGGLKEGFEESQARISEIQKMQQEGKISPVGAFPRYLGAGIQTLGLPISRATGAALQPATDVAMPIIAKGASMATLPTNYLGQPFQSGIIPASVKTATTETLTQNPDVKNVLGTLESLAALAGVKGIYSKGVKAIGQQAASDISRGVAPIGVRKRMQSEIKLGESAGLLKPDLRRITSGTPIEKESFKKMFRIAEQNVGQRGPAVRPQTIIGKDMTDMASFIENKAKSIGGLKDKLMTPIKTKAIDITDSMKSYESILNKLKIQKKPNGTLDFRNSKFAGNKQAQSLINLLNKRLRPNTQGRIIRTPERIDTIRGEIFDLAKLGKQNKLFGKEIDAVVGKFRSSLTKPIEAVAPGYREASKQYAQARKVLEDFAKHIGHKGDIGALKESSLKAGEVAGRALSERSAETLRVINNLTNMAKKLGYTDTGSITKKIKFADMLEDVFGTTQTRGFKGQIKRAGMEVAEGTKDVAQGVVTASPSTVASGAAKIYKTFTGSSPAKQIKALKQILNIKN